MRVLVLISSITVKNPQENLATLARTHDMCVDPSGYVLSGWRNFFPKN